MDSSQIRKAWVNRFGDINMRSIQRYLMECAEKSDEKEAKKDTKNSKLAIQVCQNPRVGNRPHYKYYRNPQFRLARMNSDDPANRAVALAQILRQLAGGNRPQDDSIDYLASVVSSDKDATQRLRSGIRFVDDWIGRERATIAKGVLTMCVNSLAEGVPFNIDYKDRHGGASRNICLSPHGLVSKDGTIYLVAAENRSGLLGTYALHRLANPTSSTDGFQRIDGFDLDAYIRETHNFCHLVSGVKDPIHLVMRVAPETIYHFRERPLAPDQEISEPNADDGWFTVSAQIPATILLIPFLLSMGHWIAVLEPESIVAEMGRRVHNMARHYRQADVLAPSPFSAGVEPWSLGHEA